MDFRNSNLKIKRAQELILELDRFIKETPPFSYTLETNTHSGERSTFSKVNRIALERIVILCGDILHNLRSSLDHAYWDVVSPHISDVKKHQAIQFPFAKDEDKLKIGIKSRLAHIVSDAFYNTIKNMQPHAGKGGNIILYLIHELNIIDKHKFPTPVGDFTKLSGEIIRQQIPDFPINGTMSFGQNRKDVGWVNRNIDLDEIGNIVFPRTYLFHKNLDIQVGLIFSIVEYDYQEPVIETLENMVFEAKKSIKILRASL